MRSQHAAPWPSWVVTLVAFLGMTLVLIAVGVAVYYADGWTRPVQAKPAPAVIEPYVPEPGAPQEPPSALFDPERIERLLLQPYLKQAERTR